MKDFLETYFYSPTAGNLNGEKVIDEIIDWMNQEPDMFYDVVVGCDSSSGQEPTFPVAIVILRIGQGGRFFLKRVRYKNKKFFTWKQRILEEVVLSCSFAVSLKENLEKRMKNSSLNYEFKYIHADVGGEGETREMVKEVTGLIRGNGFEPKIKPEAYVASIVADRFT